MDRRSLHKSAAVAAFVRRFLPSSAKADVTAIGGSGSSFIDPILKKWIALFEEKTGIKIRYSPKGSGAGISALKQGGVDVACSDMPLDSETLGQNGWAQFPAVVGGVVPVVNIPGIKP